MTWHKDWDYSDFDRYKLNVLLGHKTDLSPEGSQSWNLNRRGGENGWMKTFI